MCLGEIIKTKRNIATLIILFISFSVIYGQELCDTTISLIPNHSFEDYSSCPTAHRQLDRANQWNQASGATTDYFNTCDYTYVSASIVNIPPPNPLPDGNGYVGFVNGNSQRPQYKEYVGTCLSAEMSAGNIYELSFDLAAGTADSGPLLVTLYGASSCVNLPFSPADSGCPSMMNPNWIILGDVLVDPSSGQWEQGVINFTPPQNINAVIIGPDCSNSYPPNYLFYYYLDNLILSTPVLKTVSISETDSCNLTLTAQIDTSGGNWQWYKDGIALTGETTDNLIAATYGDGNYAAVYTLSGACYQENHVVTIPACNNLTVTLIGDTICLGESGTLTANGALGALNYTFDWTGGGITGNSDNGTTDPTTVTQTDNPLTTTTYTVLITDNNGDTASATAQIVVNPLPTVVASVDTAICIGSSADITASGASTYVWDNGVPAGAGPHTVSPATTTTYTVTGTDANGCVNTDDVTITVNPLPTITTADATICKDDPVNICGAGGSTYTWVSLDGGLINGAANTTCIDVATDDPAATTDITRRYEVTGTDVNGCINTAISTVTFEAVCGPTVNATGDVICDGDVANLTTTINNTTGVVTYSWTPTTGLNDPTIANPTVTGLTITTTYTVIITDDLGSDTATADIVVNPLPNVSADTDAAICIGDNIDITGSGAATYTWNNGVPTGAGPHNVSPTTTTTYTVTGTDANGCVNTDDVTITVNPLPTITTIDETVCKDDPINVCGAGGNTYTWISLDGGLINGAANTACINVSTDDPAATVDVVRCYEVTGTDINGCINTATSCVTFEAICGPTVRATGGTICEGEVANLTSVISFTTGVVTYTWTPTAGLNDPTIANPSVTGLTATTNYMVIITDDLGSDTDYVDVVVNPLPPVSADTDTAICIGASATITASGASTYVWDNGLPASAGPHTVTPAVTTTYTVTGTDANGCINDSSVTITVNPLPTITTANETVCWEDSVQVCAAGGTTYNWTAINGGLFDADSTGACVYLEGDVSAPGADYFRQYQVTGTDTNGCVNTAFSTVTFEAICAPTVQAEGDTICLNTLSANLTTSVSDTTGIVAYAWTPSTNLDDPTSPHPVFTPTVDGTFTYTVTITDDLGTDTDSTIIIVHPLPTVIATVDTAICIGASATVNASGADTYVWDNGLPANAGPHLVSPALTTTYHVTGTDLNGCVNDSSVTITVNLLPIPDAGVDQTICIGDNATITATSSGVNPITYTWDQNPPGTGAGPHTLSPTATTTYTVTATDNNGCVNTDMMTITVNPLPVPDAGANQTICIGDNATIMATSSGVNPIGYTWNNDLPATAGPHNVSPTVTTTYMVTATDNNGCIDSDSVTITVNPLPIVDAGMDQNICKGMTTSVSATAQGTGPFVFNWGHSLPNGPGPHVVSPNHSTDYRVTVTDALGCRDGDTVRVNVNPNFVVRASNDTTICAGEFATLSATGASNYLWTNLTTGSPTGTGASIAVWPTGANTCYQVTGTNADGCSGTDVVCVTVEQPPVTSFTVNPVCNGSSSIFNNTTTGAVTYAWSFGDGNTSNVLNPQHVYNADGKYYVLLTATSQAGCVSAYADTAIVKYVPVANFDGINLTDCLPVNATFFNRSDSLDPTFTYFWDFSDGTTSSSGSDSISKTYSEVGSYTVRLTVTSNGCSDFQERNNYVTVHPVPKAHFIIEPNIVDIYDPTIHFTGLSIGADFWWWNFGDSINANDQHPVHLYTDTGTFTVWLRVENQFGCIDSISKPVLINDVFTFFAPNSFTPNADGINDVFLPQGHAIDLNEYTLQIFDRWGELIFQTDNYYQGWNGTYQEKPVQIDTYVCKVKLKDIFGVNHNYIGKVSIVK